MFSLPLPQYLVLWLCSPCLKAFKNMTDQIKIPVLILYTGIIIEEKSVEHITVMVLHHML